MIAVSQLSKRYGAQTALDNVDLHVDRGEVVGLLGPNGAGKTTLMKCIVGLVHPNGGRIQIDDIDLRQDKPKALSRLGFVPQRVAFPGHMSVEGVLGFYARLKQVPAAAVDQALARVEMTRHRHQRIQALSGGMLQRLGLAQALLAAPPLLILDEPTVGLDPHVSLAFRDLLEQLNTQGTTVLLSSHLLSEVEQLAHRVAVLKDGHVIAFDTIARLLTASGLPSWLWIKPKCDPQAAQRILDSAGIRTVVTGCDLKISETDGLAALDLLRAQSCAIERFWTATPTLEEVFRFLVERKQS